MSVGRASDQVGRQALPEPQFYERFVTGLGLDPGELPAQRDRSSWPRMRQLCAQLVTTRTREEWTAVFADADACVTPLLGVSEAAGHPQLAVRGTLIELDGITRPAPAPRFSRTPPDVPTAPPGSAVGVRRGARRLNLTVLRGAQSSPAGNTAGASPS